MRELLLTSADAICNSSRKESATSDKFRFASDMLTSASARQEWTRILYPMTVINAKLQSVSSKPLECEALQRTRPLTFMLLTGGWSWRV